ncbi:hypothetical protein J6590_012006 [Homalodisca vitripennis]|nr:hypothetical protein J6590_012006 [Homalodisca vitripennis]
MPMQRLRNFNNPSDHRGPIADLKADISRRGLRGSPRNDSVSYNRFKIKRYHCKISSQKKTRKKRLFAGTLYFYAWMLTPISIFGPPCKVKALGFSGLCRLEIGTCRVHKGLGRCRIRSHATPHPNDRDRLRSCVRHKFADGIILDKEPLSVYPGKPTHHRLVRDGAAGGGVVDSTSHLSCQDLGLGFRESPINQ